MSISIREDLKNQCTTFSKKNVVIRNHLNGDFGVEFDNYEGFYCIEGWKGNKLFIINETTSNNRKVVNLCKLN